MIKEAITVHESGQSDQAEDKFKSFQKHLHEVVAQQNKFLDYVHVCITCIASQQKYKMSESLNDI